jgi:endoglucanase
MRDPGPMKKSLMVLLTLIMTCGILLPTGRVLPYYTTRGRDIVDRKTGERVILRGFGLGCWLLPEGYMWGIRKLDRPRQFERAIDDLIGKKAAAEFWKVYRENFVTEDDIREMKSWGVNSVRVALLASLLQPPGEQPGRPPFRYSEEGFRFLDSLVSWCGRHRVGVIWDMHGAPGGQNAENISDSDGQARLWTEKETYWPRCRDLWFTIADRFRDRECIIGYDLLNEPLLRRYHNVPERLLRSLYVELTDAIRTVDADGIVFVEGDDWAQNFDALEPIDWDRHLVAAFHSYPPTANAIQLRRWDALRTKYNIPLWHGETGEQGPPYEWNSMATSFLESAGVGWSWWTHKKFDMESQPWNCRRTAGFKKIIDYWNGNGIRPPAEDAREWLLDQAVKTNSRTCEFLPDMVRSLEPLDPEGIGQRPENRPPEIVRQPGDVEVEEGGTFSLTVKARGLPLAYQWFRDGAALPGRTSPRLRISNSSLTDDGMRLWVLVENRDGSVKSREAKVRVKPFSGPEIPFSERPPEIDGRIDSAWNAAPALSMDRVIVGGRKSPSDCSGFFRMLWDDNALYFLIRIRDDAACDGGGQGFERDGIELYIDADNDKPDFYGNDEFQFRYVRRDSVMLAVNGSARPGIRAAQSDADDGYCMEASLPWKSIGGKPAPGNYVGVDVHANDCDGAGRKCKIAWKAERDDSYQTPSSFGTVRLVAGKK